MAATSQEIRRAKNISRPQKRYPLAHVSYGPEEIAAVVKCLNAGQTTCSHQVSAFENLFAQYIGRDHAIMVNSGSSADLLVAYGLGPATPGDEVLVPAVTWPTQVWACIQAGYRVRLVDVDPATLQFDLADLESKIQPWTRAVFPVHVLGNVGDMDGLGALAHEHGLYVIEDCCEALGTTWRGQQVGTFGQAAAFSFFFSHLINTMEGGAVVCSLPDEDRQYRLWRSHGWEPKKDYRFWFPTWGMNVRPTELQGAFGVVQMGRLDEFKLARTRNFDRLAADISGPLESPLVFPDCVPSWHGFPLMVSVDAGFSRDQLCAYLDANGVETRPIVAGNLCNQPGIQADKRVILSYLPGAEEVHKRGFYIGLASFDDPDGTAYVAEVVDQFLRAV